MQQSGVGDFAQLQKTLDRRCPGFSYTVYTLTLVDDGTPSAGIRSHCRLLYAPISL